MIRPRENTFPEANILIIDDNRENVRLVSRLLEWAGYRNVHVECDSSKGMAQACHSDPDVILLDIHMPAPDGYEILRAIRNQPLSKGIVPVLVFTADRTPETRSRALEAGASDFLTKPGDTQEILLRVNNFLQARRLYLLVEAHTEELEERVRIRTEELAQARREAIECLALAAEFRDDETGRHSQRVGELSAAIARALGLPELIIESIRLAAPVHDVGKVAIPDSVLLKSGPYSAEDHAIMKTHALIGGRILEKSESPLMKLAHSIALSHHERWDGSGYPNGLQGEEIPLAARIVAVADVYDALTSERRYKSAWTHEEAIREIRSLAGLHFDPRVVKGLMEAFSKSSPRLAA